MRFAIVENGVVENVAEADEALADNWIASDVAGPGWLYDGTVFSHPPEPPKPPRTILAGWFKAAISQMGKKAAVAAAVAQQPEWKRELWENATSVRENDTDVAAIAAALNIDLKAVFDKAEEIRLATRGEGA